MREMTNSLLKIKCKKVSKLAETKLMRSSRVAMMIKVLYYSIKITKNMPTTTQSITLVMMHIFNDETEKFKNMKHVNC